MGKILNTYNSEFLLRHRFSLFRIIASIFYEYGYINLYDKPKARRNKITGRVKVFYYNPLFFWTDFVETNGKYDDKFVSEEKYWINN